MIYLLKLADSSFLFKKGSYSTGLKSLPCGVIDLSRKKQVMPR